MSATCYQARRKALLKEYKRCELCGDKRGLEVHHIVPRICGGSDEIDNLIVVCRVCHTKLTPRSELIKMGQKRLMNRTWVGVDDFYKEMSAIYEEMEEAEDYYHVTVDDVFDVIDNLQVPTSTLSHLFEKAKQ